MSAFSKEEKLAKQRVQEHTRALREQLYEIKVEVLKAGDSYNLVTADGVSTHYVDSTGFLPTKKNWTDAGFDLITPYDVELHPGEIKKIPLNIRMHLPSGCWARIETKSGLGSKGMLVYAGVVDQDYRGIPHVIMANLNHHHSNEIITVKAGKAIAQMTMNPHSLEFYIKQVDKVDTNTNRGEGGFGSTHS